MKILLLIAVLLFTFSCAEKSSEEIYQGKLEEFFEGDFILEKDSATTNINLQKTISYNGERFFVSREDQGYSLFSVESGKKEFSFKIPKRAHFPLKVMR